MPTVKHLATALVFFALVAPPLASPATAQPASAAATKAGALTEGEVRKVDRAGGTITLKHGAIANLDMGPMTMIFRASDPRLLDGLKPGDTVKFAAAMVGQQLTVTRIDRTN